LFLQADKSEKNNLMDEKKIKKRINKKNFLEENKMEIKKWVKKD
jgi:hypothetical protein